MQILTLYRIERADGGVTVSTEKPEGAYTETKRVIADTGMILTDGNTYTPCVDTEDTGAWTEVEPPVEYLLASLMGEAGEKAMAYDILTGDAE